MVMASSKIQTKWRTFGCLMPEGNLAIEAADINMLKKIGAMSVGQVGIYSDNSDNSFT